MPKYFLDNWISIASLLTAVFAIVVPIFYQYHRKKSQQKDSLEIPKTLIVVLSDYQDKIKTVEAQNTFLQRELENIKFLPYNQQATDFNAQLEIKIEYIVKNSSLKNVDSEVYDLVNDILEEKQFKINDLFKHNEQHSIVTKFLQTYPFKQKISKHLVQIYLRTDKSEQIQYNASLLWLYMMENDSINLFSSGLLLPPNSSNESLSDEEIVEYFWNLVNVGYVYHTYNIYIENRGRFKLKFDNELKNGLISSSLAYVTNNSSRISQAACWSLVWLVDAKYETDNGLWSPNKTEIDALCKAFAKCKRFEIVKSLMFLLNYSFSKTSAYKGNFAFDCASAMDKNIKIPELSYEPVNVEISKIIFSKYLVASDEVKLFLAHYLAKYGFKDLSVATRLLTSSIKEKDADFILFVLIPYISLSQDKSLISYVSEWINSEDELVQFYGLLFQKVLELVSKEVLELITDNEHSITSLNQMTIANSFDIELFDRKKSTTIYKVIRLMYGHCHKLKAKDTTSRWAWYVVLVAPEDKKSFLKAIEGDGTIDLEDFGKVIISAYGDQTPDNLDDLIFKQYS